MIGLCIRVLGSCENAHECAFDFETLLPEFVCISDGKGADNTIAKQLHLPPGTIVVADRIYSDTELLNLWDSNGVLFVVNVSSI